MGKTRAWELLHDPNYSGRLGVVDLYNLMLQAGYTKEEAQEAANKRGWDRLAAEETM